MLSRFLASLRRPALVPVAAAHPIAPVPVAVAAAPAGRRRKVSPRLIAGTALATLCCGVLQNLEGTKLVAYRDVIGVPTACTGETKGIRMGMTFTRTECDAMLLKRLTEDFAPAMEACARQPMGDDQYAANLSLAYNIGVGAYCKSSVVRLWNQGDRRASCQAFMLYDKAGGRVIKGLVKRREYERALCLKGV